MKKLLCLSLALVLAGTIASCGGGGGSSKYNFNGRWLVTEVVTEDPYGLAADLGVTVGVAATYIMRITQDGGAIILTDEDTGLALYGTADPKAKTFVAEITVAGLRLVYTGHGDSKNTMSGEVMLQYGALWARGVWTADLIGRGLDRGKSLDSGSPFMRLFQQLR